MSYPGWKPPLAEDLRRRCQALREATLGATAAFGASNVGGYAIPLGPTLRRKFPYNMPPYKTIYSPWDPRTKKR